MTEYIVISALCGVIAAQTVIFYRERVKLYGMIGTPEKTRGGGNKIKKRGTAHRRALEKWRNGGGYN